MKKRKTLWPVFFTALIAFAVCHVFTCKAYAAEDIAGEYNMFAMSSDGYTLGAEDLGATSVLILSEDGTGSMSMDDDSTDIARWTLDGETFTLTAEDQSSISGLFKDGIIELDFSGTGDYLVYFAKEGTDTSSVEVMTLEEVMAAMAAAENTQAADTGSLLYPLYQSMNVAEGVHMNYQADLDYMESTMVYDVHAKGGIYYSKRSTEVSGYTSDNYTLFRDEAMMLLDPEEKVATITTTASLSVLKDNALILDNLYSEIQTAVKETEFTTETRELDGVSYTVEIHPATSEYTQDWEFYFDEEGNLKFAKQGAIKTESLDLGESFYTIFAIDDAVDESLFDISDYEVKEMEY